MNDVLKTANPQIKNSGAPIKVILFILACWFIARILLYSFEPQSGPVIDNSPLSSIAEIQTDLEEITEVESFKLTGLGGTNRQFLSLGERTIFSDRNQRNWPLSVSVLQRNFLEKSSLMEILSPKTSRGNGEMPSPSLLELPGKPELKGKVWVKDPAITQSSSSQKESSLSGYFWVFARDGIEGRAFSNPLAQNQIAGGSYGGSQAGAILSYRIADFSGGRLSAFGRVSSAFSTRSLATEQEEVAVGLKLKPLKTIPVTLHAEQRIAMKNGKNVGRAIYLAGGSRPTNLAAGVLLETYGQAGYVFKQNGSYFFDAAASLQKPVVDLDDKRLSLGFGAWAGGQKNVQRLDVGPRAEIRLPMGDQSARLSVDWRHKVAGNADLNSGVAVTISTGF